MMVQSKDMFDMYSCKWKNRKSFIDLNEAIKFAIKLPCYHEIRIIDKSGYVLWKGE